MLGVLAIDVLVLGVLGKLQQRDELQPKGGLSSQEGAAHEQGPHVEPVQVGVLGPPGCLSESRTAWGGTGIRAAGPW